MPSHFERSALLLVLLLVAGAAAMAQSDFGDAPDGDPAAYPGFPGVIGKYPTLATTSNTRFPGNVGIEHDSTTDVWLGGPASVTTLEAVANVSDLDVDDSGAYVWISLTGIPAGAVLSVPVTIASDAPDGPYYLNVLIDQNNDGEWKDTPTLREWAVRDRLIDQAPGTTMRHGVPVWWSSSVLLLPKWVRITVSAVPVGGLMSWGGDGWDGSTPPGLPLGVGETEDRFLGGTYPGTAGPGGGPPPGPAGGGVPGGAGGGALGKGVVGPAAPGACEISVNCEPKGAVIPCPEEIEVHCEIEYLSGICPAKVSLGGGGQCNVIVPPKLVERLRGTGPHLSVSPPWACADVGPDDRTAELTFTAHFPPPCDQQVGRVERWSFDAQLDPDGIYGTVGPDEREGLVLSSVAGSCGNGIPEPPVESCDDGNLLPGDTCAPDCQFPMYVPNGILEPGEHCDDGNTSPGDGCGPFGVREYCGNGTVDPHEVCDDGNTDDGDGCNRFCQPETAASCPNGTVDHELEQCDDGNSTDGDGCDAYCQFEVCGDGALDLGEQCDDGNTDNGDGCSATCLSEGACGNGWTDAAEECDDGNTVDEDGCDATCALAPVHVVGLRVLDDRSTLRWDPAFAPLRRYEVLRGDLGELRAAGGTLGGPGTLCVAGLTVESADVSADPAPGQAFYYLARIGPDRPGDTTWEPALPAPGAAALRDTTATPCD